METLKLIFLILRFDLCKKGAFVSLLVLVSSFISSPTSADMFYDTQVTQEPKNRDYSEFYKIKNYIKGVHYSWDPAPEKGEDSERKKHNGDNDWLELFRPYFIKTVILPDGTNPWSRIVATQLRKRGFSEKK